MRIAADDTKFCPHLILLVYNSKVYYTRCVNYSTVILITVFLCSVHSLLWYQKAFCLKYSNGLLKEPNLIVRNKVSFKTVFLEEKCFITIRQNFLMEVVRIAYLELEQHVDF